MKQVFDILENPLWAGAEVIKQAIHKAGEDYQRKRNSRRVKAIKEWRSRISQQAAEGRREAFSYLKQADLPLCDEMEQKGTAQVIRANEELWGLLWMHEQGKKFGKAHEFVSEHTPRATLTAERVSFAAKAFSPTTSCTDEIPPKAVALLSDELLGCLADMGNWWIEQAVWPSAEAAVHIALIPKPTGGERPIGLFRSIIRVGCKAAAWDGLKSFDAQDTQQLNTSKGRRIGDAIWRAQMRSQIGEERHAGKS